MSSAALPFSIHHADVSPFSRSAWPGESDLDHVKDYDVWSGQFALMEEWGFDDTFDPSMDFSFSFSFEFF